MKALKRLSNKPFDMKLVEISEPKITNDDWIKVKVAYTGICGSDIKMLEKDCSDKYSKLKPPIIPGHEASGVVVETGSNVKNVQVGDRIVYHTIVDNCGYCKYCFSGDWGLCKQRKGLGSTMNGSFAEYIIVPSRNAIILPNEISLRIAALCEPLACAVRIVEDIGKVKRGEKVVIVGPGTIGACCALVAKANGATAFIIGTEHSLFRMNILKRMGFNCEINTGDIEKKVIDYFGEKADLAIEAVGNELAFNFALCSVKRLGRIVVAAADEIRTCYSIDVFKLFREQIQMLTSCSTRPENWLSSVQILKTYTENFDKIANKVYTIDRWQDAIKSAASKEAFKVMIKFSEGKI